MRWEICLAVTEKKTRTAIFKLQYPKSAQDWLELEGDAQFEIAAVEIGLAGLFDVASAVPNKKCVEQGVSSDHH